MLGKGQLVTDRSDSFVLQQPVNTAFRFTALEKGRGPSGTIPVERENVIPGTDDAALAVESELFEELREKSLALSSADRWALPSCKPEGCERDGERCQQESEEERDGIAHGVRPPVSVRKGPPDD